MGDTAETMERVWQMMTSGTSGRCSAQWAHGTSHPDTLPSITPPVVTPAPVSGYLLVACIVYRYCCTPPFTAALIFLNPLNTAHNEDGDEEAVLCSAE